MTISRCSNNYGPYHFPEKLIPLIISRALADEKLPVYGKGENVRDWLHVSDHCEAIDLILHKGRVGEVYNVGGHNERTNLEVVKTILKALDKPESLIEFVTDRRDTISAMRSIRRNWRQNLDGNQNTHLRQESNRRFSGILITKNGGRILSAASTRIILIKCMERNWQNESFSNRSQRTVRLRCCA